MLVNIFTTKVLGVAKLDRKFCICKYKFDKICKKPLLILVIAVI